MYSACTLTYRASEAEKQKNNENCENKYLCVIRDDSVCLEYFFFFSRGLDE